MDAGKVHILLDCLEEGSMMKAAEKLGYTPSGLTHMMDALERELGVQIIERGRYGIRLTEAGKELLPLLERFTQTEQEILRSARRINQANSGVIRIGSYPSMARNWLPQIISSFQEQHPDFRIEIVVHTREGCYDALKSGQVDLLFACQNEEYDYRFLPMKKDDYMAVLPKGSYQSEDGYFKIHEFEKFPFLMPSYGRDKDVGLALKQNGVEPRQLDVYSDNAVIISMVNAGMGATALAEMVLRGLVVNAEVLPIVPKVFRVIGLVYKSDAELTPAEKLFIEHVKGFNIK